MTDDRRDGDGRVSTIVERYDRHPPSALLVRTYAKDVIDRADGTGDYADLIAETARQKDVDVGELAAQVFRMATRQGEI